MPEIRVTINERLNAILDEIVASGLFPSKAEFVRSGIIQFLKELGLLSKLMSSDKKD